MEMGQITLYQLTPLQRCRWKPYTADTGRQFYAAAGYVS